MNKILNNPESNPTYHNTWKLLRSYRDVVWSLEVSANALRSGLHLEYGGSLEDLIDSLYLAEVNMSGTNIESHARTLERSRKMLQLIDSAIELMRTKHKNGEAYYWILYYSYLSPQVITQAEMIVEKLLAHIPKMSYRSYYRKKKEAVETLSTILWGYTTKDKLDLIKQFFPEDF